MAKHIIAVALIFVSVQALAETGAETSWYDLAVFAFDEGDYATAESHIKKALGDEPKNPYCLHVLGAVCLKTNRLWEARDRLQRAFDADPNVPGLRYDLAYSYYKSSKYGEAGELFSGIGEQDHAYVLAQYHAGICRFKLRQYGKALVHFSEAIEKSETAAVNGNYYKGICQARTGDTGKAADSFTFVRDNAEPGPLRNSAVKWLKALDGRKDQGKPFRLSAKFGAEYDSNIRMDPNDEETVGREEEDDLAIRGMASGAWDFLRLDKFVLGAGYAHYQSWYQDFDEFDMAASLPSLYSVYSAGDISFGLSYLPAFYWVDSETYLGSHRITPELKWKVSGNFGFGMAYQYTHDDYSDDDAKDGGTNGVFLTLLYDFTDSAGLSASAGYEDKSASEDVWSRSEFRGNIALMFNLPLNMALELSGGLASREYDGGDPYYGKSRNDDKYTASAGLSGPIGFDWLGYELEVGYTNNDSDINAYDYERTVAGVSMTATY